MSHNKVLAHKGHSMKLRITHETLYHYTPTVETAQHVAHLHPPITPCQSCQHHQLSTEPEATQVSSNIDAFGNHRLYWSLPSPHSTLKVTAKSELETFPIEDNRLNALKKQMLHLPWENAVLAYRYRADIASDEAFVREILNKERVDIPSDIDRFNSEEVAKKIKEEYIKILND